MNITCFAFVLQRFATVAILFTFLVLASGCSDVRYDNTKKKYRLGSDAGSTSNYMVEKDAGAKAYRVSGDEGAKTYRIPASEGKSYMVGADDNVTARYTLRDGSGTGQKPAPAAQVSNVRPDKGPPATPEMAGKGPIVIEASDVLFDFDKWVIKEAFYGELDRWVAFFLDNPQITAEIYGHADSTGPTVYNQKLSEKRAKAVVDYLVAKGVDPARLSAVGFGETRPLVPNTTPEGRQKNRRVEVNF